MGELHSIGENEQLSDRIGRALVPVIRVEGADEAVERGRAVLESGRDVLELTTTTAGWAGLTRLATLTQSRELARRRSQRPLPAAAR